MILTVEQIKSVLDKEPDYIKTLKDKHKELRMHYHGVGTTEYLSKITGLENQDQVDLRKKYARSNKNIFSNLTGYVDKVFSAKGKNKVYNISNPESERTFKEYISTIDSGKSLEKWLQSYWKDKIAADPNGIFLIEKTKAGDPYPTYKSILSIRDYKQDGQTVEYVIFEPEQIKYNESDAKKVRVYDELQDAIYIYQNNTLTLLEEETLPNELEYVPACLISDIEDTLTGFKRSTIDNEVELANEYLRDNSIKTLYKFAHGFPIFWMYYQQCSVCKGIGEIDGKPCGHCNGTGLSVKKDVSDIIGVRPPRNNEDAKITPDIAGYITPPNENLNQMTDELKLMVDSMFFSHWHTLIEVGANDTATGRFIDVQPVNDRLDAYADSLETVETLLTNFIGDIMLKEVYKGCSINYGRRFLIETPDQLLDKYTTAKDKKLNPATLDYLLEQYYQAQFATDTMMYSYYKKLMQLEPFLHLTLAEIPEQYQNTEDYKKKLYFDSWKNQISIDDVVKFDVKKLDKLLVEYINAVALKEPPKEDQNIQKKIESQAVLRGSVGGVTALIELQQSVVNGYTPLESAIEIVKEIYGIEESIARKMIGNKSLTNNKTDEQINDEPATEIPRT